MERADYHKRRKHKTSPRKSHELTALEQILGVQLPESYKRFLEERGNAVVNGLPLLGFPISTDIDSAWGATELLRGARPDLPDQLVVVRLLDSRALCLDLREMTSRDVPLVQVDLKGDDPPQEVHQSFDEYLSQADRSKRQIEGALRRIRWHLDNARKTYDHANNNQRPPFRPHDWRVMRSCVHDHIVGLAAIKHNEDFGGLEVDAFVCTDHPDYEPGHGVRALTILLLSDAYRNSGSMEIRFTRFDSRSRLRVAERIPFPIASLGKRYNISFSEKSVGIISNEEAVRLFVSLMNLDEKVEEAVRALESRNIMSLKGICHLLSARLWSREEASWVMLNHPRPQGLFYGEDYPEDRFEYIESLSYGRAAVAMSSFREKLSVPDGEYDGDCGVRILGPIWELSPQRELELDWYATGEKVVLGPEHKLAVLPRPRIRLPHEHERILDDAQELASHRNGQSHSFLLYSKEILETPNLLDYVAKARADYSVDILVLPTECRALDEIVELRMSNGRMLVR